MALELPKNKVVLYGGGFFVLLILVLLYRRLSGGAPSGTISSVSTAVDPATLQAQTSLALAQIGAASQAAQTNAQLVVAQQATQADLAKYTIQADVARYTVDAQTHQIDVQTAASAASDARSADLQASIAKYTLDNAAQMQAGNQAFQLSYASNANASAESIAQLQATIVSKQIQSNENVTIASLASQAAQLNSYLGAQVGMNESNNAKDVSLAQISSSTSKHNSTVGAIGGIIGGILGIFSDETLKEDMKLIGREPDGLGIYSYRLRGERSYQVGVSAQEVRRLRPRALGRKVQGKLTVDYRALTAAA